MTAKADLDQKDERAMSPLDRLLAAAPLDDELVLDDDLMQESRDQAARGETTPHATVRRELLGA